MAKYSHLAVKPEVARIYQVAVMGVGSVLMKKITLSELLDEIAKGDKEILGVLKDTRDSMQLQKKQQQRKRRK